MTLLELKNIKAGYGNIIALNGIDITIEEGEIACLIGANGAGKSTTLMTISNIIKPVEGNIYFKGDEITGEAPNKIVSMGIIQVPEGRRIFPKMTVFENIQMGSYLQNGIDREVIEWIYELFPILKERKKQKAGTLSGGEQQMLAIARALMGKPELLLLDEPSLGLAPLFVEKIFEVIEDINRKGTTIFLVEQNAQVALSISDRGYVMETGNIVLSDTTERLIENEMVQKAYLGE
jgi:branched-chain amino acid transport system ATP-binding protein